MVSGGDGAPQLPSRAGVLLLVSALFVLGSCHRSAPAAPEMAPQLDAADATRERSGPTNTPLEAGAQAGDPAVEAAAHEDTSPRAPGPYELPYIGKRTVFFSVPVTRKKPQRLIANLHGVCNPPGYACGYWVHAAQERGFLVCPTGNGSCGAAAYDAPTWTGSYDRMGADLETAIGVVSAAYPGEISREGAILTGFSRGAYAAPEIAKKNPGRWPYLLLIEANVAVDVRSLRASGVRAVAFVEGEWGTEVAGARGTVATLKRQGYPAKLWVMPRAGHHYSANIDELMAEALDWLVASGDEPRVDGGVPTGGT